MEKSKVFTDYDSLGASKFYLAMDADEKDDKYKDLIDSMEKSGVDAKMNIGATQLLNSFTMKTNFEAPLYNNVFSHGMPTIGNGRRTLEDFADQSKDHVSVEKMKKVLADTLKAKAREYYKESGLDSIANVEELVNMYKDLKKLKDTPEMFKDLAQDSLKNLSQAAKDSLKSMRSEVLDSLYSKLDDVAGDLLDELESSGAMDYVDDVLDTYSEVKGFMKEYHVVEYIQGVNKLRSYKFNKDDIPGSIMELVSIVDKFIPKEYKNEVYSLFVEYFTPETRAALSKYGSCALDGRKMRDCAKEGLKLVASNLANYSLNFFDEGTFDIPVYSALGENVAAFKEAAVQKFGIPIDSLVKVYHDIKDSVNDYRNTFKGYKKTLKNQFDSLHKYQTLLKDIGELEVDRQIVDLALNIGCKALNEVNPAYGKICSAAEFATNVGLVAYTTSMVKDLVGQSGVLKYSKDLALFSSVADTVVKKLKMPHANDVEYGMNSMDAMMFGSPKVSFASVRKDSSVIPLLLLEPCLAGDVYDAATFDSLCSVKDSSGKVTGYSNATEIGLADFKDVGFSLLSNQPMAVKDVTYDSTGRKNVRYGTLDYFSVKRYVEEFRFQIDDLQPDSIRWIKFDFNTRVQIIYERVSDSEWYVYFEESYQKAQKAVDTLKVSPVTRDGLFVFDPDRVIKKANSVLGKSYGLGGLMGDGTNVVYVSLMNKVGYTSSYSFSMFFQATEFNYAVGWPVNFAQVSRLGEVSAFVNNLAYSQFKLTGAGLRVSRVEMDTTYSDSIALDVNVKGVDKNNVKYVDSTGVEKIQPVSTTWRLSANLDSVLYLKRTEIIPSLVYF